MADTIAAISTAKAVSAIGIVRISGDDAENVLKSVFKPVSGGMQAFSHGKLCRGFALGKNGGAIDDCLAVIFRAPNSYTGETLAEIHCHGSPVVLDALLRSCVSRGARYAQAGEFTRRAFLNGKLDLVKSEAVADIIEAESENAAAVAVRQLSGSVSRKIEAVYNRLIDISSHFHAVVDYTDEDIEEFDALRYSEDMREYAAELSALADTYERGLVIKNGVPLAIIGKPNVGKSSLLNALLGYERAIVTDEPGTTRDTVEDKFLLDGKLIRVTDTAGIRQAVSRAETLGIERSYEAARSSAVILAVYDASKPLDEGDENIGGAIPDGVPVISVMNKSDLAKNIDDERLPERVYVSAKTGYGIGDLTAKIQRLISRSDAENNGEIITNARQYDALLRAAGSLKECVTALQSGITPDAALSDLESAQAAIAEILGKSIKSDLIDRIFSRFCVGK